MKQIINGCKYWGQLLLLPIYWLSALVPKKKNLWLFGSTFGRRFADNPRYLYLYVSQHSKYASDRVKAQVEAHKKEGHAWQEDENCRDIQAVWISHKKEIVSFLNENGYEAYYYHSLKGIIMALRGKVYFFDNYSKDINFWQSLGAVKVNMWHGVGNKRINYDNEHDKVRHPKNKWEKFKYFPRRLSDEKPSHYILTTSPMMSEIFARAFQVPMEHIIETGYPRNDILFDEKAMINLHSPQEQQAQDKIQTWKKDGYKILGYIPTFRPSEAKFMQIMDLAKFNNYLEANHMILVCKLHPKSLFKKEFSELSYSNIYDVPAEVDINAILGEIDVLIADYSSTYSDYMLLDRPVVAFHYDYEEYTRDTRDGYFSFDDYMPEKKAITMEELECSLLDVLKKDAAIDKRRGFRGKLYKDIDNQSAKRLVQYVSDKI